MVSTGQLLWQLNKAIAPSHPSGLPRVLSDVRYWMNSRRHLLAKSISGFDPQQKSCFRLDGPSERMHTWRRPRSPTCVPRQMGMAQEITQWECCKLASLYPFPMMKKKARKLNKGS